MPFPDGSRVDVEEVSDKEWRLLSGLKYDGQRESFTVPVGAMTDFASVPRPLVWFLPRYGRYTKAAVLHDYLWRTLVPAHEISLPDADGIFRRAMRELGVPFLRRWLMWGAVRLGALKKPGGREHWLRESWLVLPLGLLALLIVGPPALLVILALTVFTIIEFVAYLPLRVAKAIQESRKKEAKAVNPPSLDWKPTTLANG